MSFYRKWYFVVFLSFLLILLITIFFVYYDQKETGSIIYSATIPATIDVTHRLQIDLQATDKLHTLVLTPNIESGWGEPDVQLEARLLSPEGKTILRIDKDEKFGDQGSEYSRSYDEKFPFTIDQDGQYELSIQCLTQHVENISIKIGLGGFVIDNSLGLLVVGCILLAQLLAALFFNKPFFNNIFLCPV